MAVEFGHFLSEQLDKLPADHPDRPFLVGLQQVVGAYVEQQASGQELGEPTEPAPRPAPVEHEAAASEYLVTAAVTPTGRSAPAEQAGRELEHGERVRLSGNVGAPPRFRTTSKGIRRGEFNLAVHDEHDTTTWHTVLAFRERAETLEQLQLVRGQAVEVIGYRHERQTKARDGKPKTVEEIIAASVRAR
jgi:single-stranded DNA-binding protein